MLTGSVNLGRWVGISVRVHWSVLLIAVLLGTGLAQTLGWVVAGVGVFAFLGSILAHEFSHALVARHFGVGTRSIELWALGGMARLDREAPTPRAEGWIAAAGPLASLLLGLMALGLWFGLGTRGVGPILATELLALLGWLGLINLVLAGFNMLPGAPLDGGRVVRAVRWSRHGDRFRATREAARAGSALGWVMGGAGLWMMLNGYPGVFVMLTGVFIALNAKAEYLGSYLVERLDEVSIAELTWFGLASASAQTDVETLLWERARMGPIEMAAVLDTTGATIGLVDEHRLWEVPESERPGTTLDAVMTPLSELTVARMDDRLSSVAGRLEADHPVVVTDAKGAVVGVVPPASIASRLRSAQAALRGS